MAGERGIFDVQATVKRGALVKNPNLDAILRAVVIKAAHDIEARAKQRITDQRAVDTGATRASIYVRYGGRGAGGHDTYYGALAAARVLNPDAEFLEPGMPDVGDGHAAMVGPSTSYAAYIEFGTVHMPARPYLVPALADVSPGFQQAAAAAITKYGTEP